MSILFNGQRDKPMHKTITDRLYYQLRYNVPVIYCLLRARLKRLYNTHTHRQMNIGLGTLFYFATVI